MSIGTIARAAAGGAVEGLKVGVTACAKGLVGQIATVGPLTAGVFGIVSKEKDLSVTGFALRTGLAGCANKLQETLMSTTSFGKHYRGWA